MRANRLPFLTLMITATVLLMSMSEPAYAYLDPGTGSILIQGLLAAIAGAAMTIKLYWRRIVQIFSSKSKEVHKQTSEQASDNS